MAWDSGNGCSKHSSSRARRVVPTEETAKFQGRFLISFKYLTEQEDSGVDSRDVRDCYTSKSLERLLR